MRIGICSISNQRASISEVIRIASKIGYSGIEIWGKEQHIGNKSITDARRIVDISDDESVNITTYGSYLKAGDPSLQNSLQAELKFADQLGADMIRVWAGGQEYEDCTQAHWETVVEDLRMIADQAQQVGLTVTVERHYGTLTNRQEGALQLLIDVNHPNCGLNWQTYCETGPGSNNNIHRTESEVVSDIRKLAPVTNSVHVQSWPEPEADHRCLIEDSFYNWEKILSVLEGAGYNGPIHLELTDPSVDYEIAIQKEFEVLSSITSTSLARDPGQRFHS